MNDYTEAELKYADIINLPHHVSKKHAQMSRAERAAQFSPFAALTGYGDKVNETERLTDEKTELSDDEKYELNGRLQKIMKDPLKYWLSVTYFKKDEFKSGGKYITVRTHVKRIDETNRRIVLEDGTQINIDDLYALEAE